MGFLKDLIFKGPRNYEKDVTFNAPAEKVANAIKAEANNRLIGNLPPIASEGTYNFGTMLVCASDFWQITFIVSPGFGSSTAVRIKVEAKSGNKSGNAESIFNRTVKVIEKRLAK